MPGFPIQKSADQRLFAPPRSLSQLITSFIGSQCQGIHPTLLFVDRFCGITAPRYHRACSVMPTACLDLLKIWCLFQDFSFLVMLLLRSISSDVLSLLFLDIRYVVFKVQILSLPLCGNLMEMKRFELSTPCLQGRCSPTELHPRVGFVNTI